jgi:hypothetical protein
LAEENGAEDNRNVRSKLELHEIEKSRLTQSYVGPETADEADSSDEDEEVDHRYKDTMTVVIVLVYYLERGD